MQRAARNRAVEQPHELAVLGGDATLVAVPDGSLEALRQRLRGRAVVQVLEPLLGSGADALLLLLDVRHVVKRPAVRGRRHGTRGCPPYTRARGRALRPPARKVDGDLL